MSVEAMSDAELNTLRDITALYIGVKLSRAQGVALIARLDAAERERDELRAAQGWRTIDSAPRDGTRIMVWRKAEDGFESRQLGVDMWRDNCWWMSRKPMPPTHWQPLPSPPTR